MVSLRTPSKAFNQADCNGNRLWPEGVDRNELDPYFEIAETMLNVEQIKADEIPKSGIVFSKLMKNLGYTCDRARYAVKDCAGSGYCVSGCIFGAKQSLHYNYLPQAKNAGTEILTDTEAVSISSVRNINNKLTDQHSINDVPYRYKIICSDTKNNYKFAVEAKIVILGCGTVGTAKLLLKSRENLPLLSSHVGKNIAFNGSIKAAGLLPDGFIEGDMLTGRTHPGLISYQFFDSMGITISSIKVLPLQLVTAARLSPDGEMSYWGTSHTEMMKQYRRKMIILYALGLTPPCAEIIQVDDDEFQPVLKINNKLRSYYKQTIKLLHSIFLKNGCKVIDAKSINHEGSVYEGTHFDTSHMIGSCRMADDKEHGVVDKFGEVFDYPGLYISDGAVIPSSLAVNSSLTILANAERIAANMIKKYAVKISELK
jgi:enediyne biosynthesis protein E9